MRRTKIVTTLGPSTANPKTVEALINAGVNVFRLNFSHGTQEDHLKNIQMIRKIEAKLKQNVAILQDISGPKIRVGNIEGEILLESGKRYTLNSSQESKGDVIPFPHEDIIKYIVPGTKIFFADGTMRAFAVKCQRNSVEIEVEVGGRLTSKKGVNFPDLSFKIPALTKKDLSDLAFGIENGVDLVAISFVRNKNDVLEAKAVAQAYGGGVWIMPKIEKKEAIENIDEILEVSDGVMVARGDLGVELGVENVPVAQKMIIKKANALGIPAITATQMLTSMVNSPYPTRAEVSDIANAVLDGTDAVMLSDETAVGKFPTQAVDVLIKTISQTEEIYPFYHFANDTSKDNAIAASATKLSQAVAHDAIVVFTSTGNSAKKMSKYRPQSRIITATHTKKVARLLSVVWGVVPSCILPQSSNTDEVVYHFMKEGVENKWLDPKQVYIFTMGYPSGQSGSTNLIRLIDDNFFRNLGLA